MYWLLFYPLDVIKSALQTDALVKSQRKYCGIGDAAKQLYAEGGISRFYKGLTPCLIRSVPANAVMLITNVRVFWGERRTDLRCSTADASLLARRQKCAPCWIDAWARQTS
jgi:hypothetical protein